MTIQFSWIKPTRVAGGGKGSNFIQMNKIKAGSADAEGNQRYQLALTIPERVMIDARLVIGDRVEVGFANDSVKGVCIAIRRVLEGGYAITLAGNAVKGAVAAARGKSLRGRVSFMFRDGCAEKFSSEFGGCTIENNMIIAWEGK